MTYKHTDLSNSVVGQALLKIAVKQGLITPEKSEKFRSVADVQQELTAFEPTSSMPENLLKLCSGLRQKGLTSYADTLESKFLQYKQAENALYDVHKETGEDVINQAHPAGSHAMENLEGDATIETILDRSKKIQDAVLKGPTGKLASKDILNIVRIILAQSQPDQFQITLEDIKNKVETSVSNVNAILDKILLIASTAHRSDFDTAVSGVEMLLGGPIAWLSAGIKEYFKTHKSHLQDLKNYLKNAKADFDKDSSQENVQAIKQQIDDIKEEIDNMPSDNNLNPLKTQFDTAAETSSKLLDAALGEYSKLSITQPEQVGTGTGTKAPPDLETVNPVVSQYNQLTQKIYDSNKINKDGKIAINDWLQKNKPDFNDPQASQKIKEIEQNLVNKGLI